MRSRREGKRGYRTPSSLLAHSFLLSQPSSLLADSFPVKLEALSSTKRTRAKACGGSELAARAAVSHSVGSSSWKDADSAAEIREGTRAKEGRRKSPDVATGLRYAIQSSAFKAAKISPSRCAWAERVRPARGYEAARCPSGFPRAGLNRQLVVKSCLTCGTRHSCARPLCPVFVFFHQTLHVRFGCSIES